MLGLKCLNLEQRIKSRAYRTVDIETVSVPFKTFAKSNTKVFKMLHLPTLLPLINK